MEPEPILFCQHLQWIELRISYTYSCNIDVRCRYDAIDCTQTNFPLEWRSKDSNSHQFEFEFNQRNYTKILITCYGIRKYSTYLLLDVLYYVAFPFPYHWNLFEQDRWYRIV